MKRPPRRYWHEHRGAAFWLVLLLFAIWRAYSAAAPASPERLDEGMHEVRRVVDGDTLLLTSGARVRLQGVNTPETVKPDSAVEAWGPEASQFTKDFIDKAGHRVRLTFSLERKDRYDRFLAFVWDGDVMLNEELRPRRFRLRPPRLSLQRHDETPLPPGPGRSPQGRAGNLVEPCGRKQ